jgi:hypothetical protein
MDKNLFNEGEFLNIFYSAYYLKFKFEANWSKNSINRQQFTFDLRMKNFIENNKAMFWMFHSTSR